MMDSLPDGDGRPPGRRNVNPVKAFLAVISARRWVVVATLAGVVLCTFAGTLFAPKTYATEAKMLAASGARGAALEQYADLIEQPPIPQRVRDDLRLGIEPDALLGHLAVRPLPNTSTIAVTADWDDARTSAAIANEFVHVFVERERESIASQAASTLDVLNAELPAAAARLAAANAALAGFSASEGVARSGARTPDLGAMIAANELETERTLLDLRRARAELESERAALAPKLPQNGLAMTDPVVGQLEAQLATAAVQLASARREYTDESIGVETLAVWKEQLEAAISKLRKRLFASVPAGPDANSVQRELRIARLSTQIRAGEASLTELRRQRAAFESPPGVPFTTGMRLADFQQRAKSAQAVYADLQRKYDAAAATRAASPSDVRMTQSADARRAMVRPDLRVNLVIGAIVGLVAALAAALAVNVFDKRVKSEADVAHRLRMPTLGSIPLVARMDPKSETYARVRDITIEAFLRLATALRYASDEPLKTIAFISPEPGDGKSTIALNVAIAMGEMEPYVLLIDADFRQPKLHTLLNARNGCGLSDLLVGRVGLDAVIQETSMPGLHFVSSGTEAPNPVKLFRTQRMDDFLTHASRRYSCIIIDTPATDGYVDGVVLAAKSDASVVVVSRNKTDASAASKTVALLARFGVKNVLGVVLNRVRPRSLPQTSSYQLENVSSGIALNT
jgi:capsular exopolysaccharide synthesis family protein